MLTVKWIYIKDGAEFEHVFEADRVSSAFATDIPDATPRSLEPPVLFGRDVGRGVVVLNGPGLDGVSFDCGRVYVMNERGRTVSSYQLDRGGPVTSSEAADRAPLMAAA